MVRRSVIISKKGGKLHFHAPIGALVALVSHPKPSLIKLEYTLTSLPLAVNPHVKPADSRSGFWLIYLNF